MSHTSGEPILVKLGDKFFPGVFESESEKDGKAIVSLFIFGKKKTHSVSLDSIKFVSDITRDELTTISDATHVTGESPVFILANEEEIILCKATQPNIEDRQICVAHITPQGISDQSYGFPLEEILIYEGKSA